LSQVGLGPGLN